MNAVVITVTSYRMKQTTTKNCFYDVFVDVYGFTQMHMLCTEKSNSIEHLTYGWTLFFTFHSFRDTSTNEKGERKVTSTASGAR